MRDVWVVLSHACVLGVMSSNWNLDLEESLPQRNTKRFGFFLVVDVPGLDFVGKFGGLNLIRDELDLIGSGWIAKGTFFWLSPQDYSIYIPVTPKVNPFFNGWYMVAYVQQPFPIYKFEFLVSHWISKNVVWPFLSFQEGESSRRKPWDLLRLVDLIFYPETGPFQREIFIIFHPHSFF